MAKIPTILESGRADGKLVTTNSIFDENKSMFQSELNDIQDTLTSDNSNKPLSAKQGKILKDLLDSKVIEAGSIPIDTKPIEGNITHLVNSDGLAKEFNKYNIEIISGSVYDVSSHNNGIVFESLQALLSSSNLSTLIPTSVRHGGMSIRFIQGSVPNSGNKYVQYRLMSPTWSTVVANWQGVDDEPIAGSDNLVKSGGVAKAISNLYNIANVNALSLEQEFIDVEFKTGYMYDNELNLISNTDSKYADPIEFSSSLDRQVVICLKNTSSQSTRAIGLKNNVVIQKIYERQPTYKIDNLSYYIFTPNNVADKIYISFSSSAELVFCALIKIFSSSKLNLETIDTGTILSGSLYNQNLNLQQASKFYYYSPIDISNFQGKTIIVRIIPTDLSTSGAYIGVKNSDGSIITAFRESSGTLVANGVYEFRFNNPNATLLCISKRGNCSLEGVYVENTCKEVIYIGSNGDDKNEGTTENPMKTINAALKKGAKKIVMLAGVYNEENKIDLSLVKKGNLTIVSNNGGKVIIKDKTGIIINDGKEILESGYTKVYKHSLSRTPANWIFQDDVDDVTTFISDEERHPCQRRSSYRCDSTLIKKCASETLENAIDEIETSAEYLYFYDSVNNLIYFSRPESTGNHPIYSPILSSKLFSGNNRSVSIEMIGIEVRYMGINATELAGCKFVDCASKFSQTDSWSLDNSVATVLVRCEAARCFVGANGDGFNVHSDKTDNYDAKHSTTLMINCWAHDVLDDGYSDHERCETHIIGGLFEYCGKGGLTPSFGAKDFFQEVTCRRMKGAGIFVLGTASNDNYKKTPVVAMNCYSYNNSGSNYRTNSYNVTKGVIVNLINCISYNARVVGYQYDAYTFMKLINCYHGGNGDAVGGDGTLQIENATLVTL